VKERNEAKLHFYEFVNTIYKGLHRIESNVNGAKSALSVFCRIDIGLIMNPRGEVRHLF
jgi:hypothetical protein